MTAPPPDPARTAQARKLARSLLADPSHTSSSPDELAAGHPDLMPELGDELRKLARIRQAFARATSSSSDLDAGSGAAAELPGEALPGYAIVGEIHRGGQGVVYRAIQNATRREVAIKVLREGPFAGRHDLQRFEQEVRILARLEHPDIVTIHDRGRSGRHDYFVMDYVPGTALDEYVASGPDGNRRDVRETLTLWARVCEAVEAAHLRGVMHRDLKPGNVRVTPDGNPRVLDFGLAKQTSDEDDSAAAMTRTGQFIGSLPWASPEQAEGRLDATDLRTDVYALGVVGYQLLTGGFPYRVQGPAHEVVQRICHDTPPPVSRSRPEADDEVDTIVARCLAKEPQRRYQNAGELARDLRRYLAGDPIEAKRDSTTYVLRKLLIRHRGAVAAAALLIGVVLASTVMLTLQNRELRRSQAAEQDARATSDQVAGFLQEAITAADPYEGAGGEPTVRDLLDQAAAQIHFTLTDDPAVRIPVQRTIGTSFLNLGQLDKATEHLTAALADSRAYHAPDSAELVASLHATAELYRHTDQFELAEELLDEALAKLSDAPGNVPLRRATEILRAQIDFDRGDYPAAGARIDAVLAALQESPDPDPELLGEARNLAGLLALANERADQAADQFELAYAAYQQAHGAVHPATMTALGNIARAARVRGDYAEADRLYTQALIDLDRQLGPDHPVTLRVQQNHGLLLLYRGDLDAAQAIFEQIAARTHAGAAAARAAALGNLGLLHGRRARGNDEVDRAARRTAISYYEQARAALVALYGPTHPDVARLDFNLGTAWIPLSDLEKAAEHFASSLEIRRVVLPADHPDLNATRQRLAQARAFQGRPEEAADLALEAAASHARTGDLDGGIGVLRTVARDLVRASHPAAAIPLLERAITLLESRDDPASRDLAEQLRDAAEMLRDSSDEGAP